MNWRSPTQTKAIPSFTPVQAGLLQRKCESCGQHTIAGGECTDCGKKKIGLQRKLTIGASNDPLELEADRVADQVTAAPAYSIVGGTPSRIQRFTGQPTGQADMAVPTSVDRVLSSPGRPLEPALQQDMGQRFGHDFSRVRIHTDAAAERSAREIGANAYTVGHNIVFGAGQFALGTHDGRHLIAHELTHVVQQDHGAVVSASSALEVARPDSAEEQEADAAEHAVSQGKPVRATKTKMTQLNRKESKPPTPVNHGKMSFSMEENPARGKEDVRIVFSPDPKGPQTKSINLIQIAKVSFDNGSKWSDQQPKQAALERFTTNAGFHADVKPEDLAPSRRNKTDPNISPAYPPASVKGGSKTETDPLTGLTRNVSTTLAPQPGHNLPGDVLDASINDSPGGGLFSGVWEMETVAHSDDLGINYGAVRWSFRYESLGIRPQYTQEKSQISAAASSNVKESLIAFNKYYMNKHIVQESETLKSISIDYYGDDSQADSIYAINKQVLTDADPEARIPVGTEVEMPGRRWEQMKSTPKQNIWEQAKKPGHRDER